MKVLNRIQYTGIWTQPVVMYCFYKLFGADMQKLMKNPWDFVSILVLSFLPTIYIWNMNATAKRNGKKTFGLLDSFDTKMDPAYQTSLRARARYPSVHESLLAKSPEGILFGRYQGQYVRKQIKEDGHIFVIGGTGAGKSTCIVIPTLLTNPEIGSFAIDIKGELSMNTAKLGDVDTILFNPQDRGTYGYDPFYRLGEDAGEQEIMECMQTVAASLISIPVDIKDPFWKQSARKLLTGLLIFYYKKKFYTLPDICAEILKKPLKESISEIVNQIEAGGVEAYYLSSFKNMADETLSGIEAEVSLHITIFAADQNIKYAFRENPLKMNPDMLNHGKHIYLSVREEKLTAYYDVLQLIINQTLSELELRPEGADPILFIIDELPRVVAQGKLERLLDGARTLRSRNVTLIMITQSVEALLSAYKECEVDDLISNCAYVAVLSASSKRTQEKIISWSGQFMERRVSYSGGNGKDAKRTISYEMKDIVEAVDLVTLPDSGELILITKRGYNRIKKAPYYRDRKLEKKSKEITTFNKEIKTMEEKYRFRTGDMEVLTSKDSKEES